MSTAATVRLARSGTQYSGTMDSSSVPATDMPHRWSAPLISVLVAAWNEAHLIERHITSFQSLSYQAKELIICAGGTDDTHRRAKALKGDGVVVIVQLPGEGKQRALQQCLSHARGSIIYLTDADCLYTDEAFQRLLAPILSGTAEVVTGVSEPLPSQRDKTLIQYQWYRDRDHAEHLPEKMYGVLGRNCALKRSVLDSVGEFSTPAHTGTDYVLSHLLLSAGYEIHTVRDSRMPSEYPEQPMTYLHMWRRWNKNLLVQGSRHKRWSDVRAIFVAAGIYSSIPLLPLLRGKIGRVAFIAPFALVLKGTLNRYRRLKAGAGMEGRRLTIRNVVTLPAFTVLDMLAVILAVFDAVVPSRRSRW